MYEYNATVTKVIDGDTFEAIVDLGFKCSCVQTFRMAGINAPETKGDTLEAGRLSKEFLSKKIFDPTLIKKIIKIKSHKPNASMKQEKYGRWLADVWVDGVYLNMEMVSEGMAVSYMT